MATDDQISVLFKKSTLHLAPLIGNVSLFRTIVKSGFGDVVAIRTILDAPEKISDGIAAAANTIVPSSFPSLSSSRPPSAAAPPPSVLSLTAAPSSVISVTRASEGDNDDPVDEGDDPPFIAPFIPVQPGTLRTDPTPPPIPTVPIPRLALSSSSPSLLELEFKPSQFVAPAVPASAFSFGPPPAGPVIQSQGDSKRARRNLGRTIKTKSSTGGKPSRGNNMFIGGQPKAGQDNIPYYLMIKTTTDGVAIISPVHDPPIEGQDTDIIVWFTVSLAQHVLLSRIYGLYGGVDTGVWNRDVLKTAILGTDKLLIEDYEEYFSTEGSNKRDVLQMLEFLASGILTNRIEPMLSNPTMLTEYYKDGVPKELYRSAKPMHVLCQYITHMCYSYMNLMSVLEKYEVTTDVEVSIGSAVMHAHLFYCLAKLVMYLTYTAVPLRAINDIVGVAKLHINKFVWLLCNNPDSKIVSSAAQDIKYLAMRTNALDVFDTPVWEPLFMILLHSNAIIASNAFEWSEQKIDVVGKSTDLFGTSETGTGFVHSIMEYATWGSERTEINPYAVASAYLYIYGRFYENRDGLNLTYDNADWA